MPEHDYKPVPVTVALSIAENFDKSMVVILCYDSLHQLTHTTTYGVTYFEKEQAAAVGELCSRLVGCDLSRKVDYEDFHKDYSPARLKEALELLVDVDHVLELFLRHQQNICHPDEPAPVNDHLTSLRQRIAATRLPRT